MSYLFPKLRHLAVTVPFIGPFSRAELLSTTLASAAVVTWLALRNTPYGWLPQNVIGAGFLCMIQRLIRIPSIKVATVLLSIMFFFDVFWVFLSPLLFRKSVMVEVATGGGTHQSIPMLFRIPKINDPFHTDNMLGFGDIVVPGLFVSFLRRQDILSGKKGFQSYYLPAVVGYFLGLCVTLLVLMLTGAGQPALLYLVPGTLGTAWVLAWKRGEAARAWRGATLGSGAGSAGDDPQAAASRAGGVGVTEILDMQQGLAENPHHRPP